MTVFLMSILNQQQQQKDALASLIKNSSIVYYDGFTKPFNNVKSTIGKSSLKDRIEFFEGFIEYMIDNSHEEAIILPGLQDEGELSWSSKTTKVALGLAYLSKAERSKASLGSIKCNLYILEGMESKSESVVPGLTITSVSAVQDLPIKLPNPEASLMDYSPTMSMPIQADAIGKRKLAIPNTVGMEPTAKRQKILSRNSTSYEDDGEIIEEPAPSKKQPPYLIWEKYHPPVSVVYQESSLGAVLSAPNSINSRPDLFGRQVSSSVIGIDYGTDWLKVSILKPGGAIETVLNRESKRKTNAVINIRKGIRSYGIESITLGMRFPQWTYGQLKNLIGKPFNDPAVTGYDSSNPRFSSDRGTVVFQHDQDEVYEVEELVAMLLKHCKKQAEDYGGVKVSGAVITVPPDFSQFERQAILDAGDIADLKILGLIHDETAVAISYVLGKKFETLEYHLFYDMGAGSTVATLVSFQSGKTALTKKNIDVMIKGYATDSDLGGLQVDIRIQRHLASEFAKVNKGKLSGDIFKDNRAMARLMKEANRVKTILSANQNVLSSVEGLMDGIDFKLEVSRETLEKLCKDLFARSAKPIETVLKSSNITLDKVKSLVLFGGGARIPAVQKWLSALVGDAKIARNVDGDEAAVLGAVLHAASLSPQYKLGQTFNIKDLAPRAIYVSYSQEKSESKNEILVFPEYSLLGSKKNIRFNRESDFELEVHYKPTSSQKSGTKIAKVTVTGVTDAFEKYESTKNDVPIVKIQIDLNESGLLVIKNPIALFEVVVDEASDEKDKKGSSWSLFGGGKKDKKDTESEKNQDDSSAEEKNDEEKSSNGESDHSGDDGETTAKEKVPTKEKSKKTAKKVDIKTAANGKKVRTEKVNLKYEITWLTVPPLSQKAKDAMRSRLEEFDAGDKERLELQAARNSLETFIYKCKELTYDDDIEDLATVEEQAALKAAASEASDWYEDNSELMVRKEFISKKNELFKLGGPIFKRRKEHSMRPSVIESLQAEIQKVQEIYNQFEGKINETDVTETELEKLKNILHNVTEWLNEKSIAQAKLQSNVDPILTVQSLEGKRAILSSSVEKFDWKKRLRRKAKPSSKGDGKSKDSSYPAGDFDPDGFDPDMMDEETKKKLKDPQISTEEMMKVIKEAIAKKQKNQKANPQDNTKEASSDSSEAKNSPTKDKEETLGDYDKNSENEEQNDEL